MKQTKQIDYPNLIVFLRESQDYLSGYLSSIEEKVTEVNEQIEEAANEIDAYVEDYTSQMEKVNKELKEKLGSLKDLQEKYADRLEQDPAYHKTPEAKNLRGIIRIYAFLLNDHNLPKTADRFEMDEPDEEMNEKLEELIQTLEGAEESAQDAE